MKILLAPDAFKGTMSSHEVSTIMKEVLKDHDVEVLALADGGEGTLSLFDGQLHHVDVCDPLMRPTNAQIKIHHETAYIEMAEASGILKLRSDEKNPLKTNTYGTGELILYALDQGVKTLVIGIGGSATNDAGMGMLEALGVCFYDQNGKRLSPCGEALKAVHVIDCEMLDQRLEHLNIEIMCDVNNPFTGVNGATYIYGPQKGADHQMLMDLEAGMVNMLEIIKNTQSIDLNVVPGSGAAGGIGGAFYVYLKGELKSGIEVVLEHLKFEEHAQSVDYVFTGEGMFDHQSLKGKVIDGIRNITKDLRCKLVVIAGYTSLKMVPDIDEIYSTFDSIPDDDLLNTESKTHLKRTMEKWLQDHQYSNMEVIK